MIEHFSVHSQTTITNLTRVIAPVLLARCQGLRAATSDNGNLLRLNSFLFFFFFKTGTLVNKREYESKYCSLMVGDVWITTINA